MTSDDIAAAAKLVRENAGRDALLPFIKKFQVPQKIKRDDGAWRKRTTLELKAALQHKLDQLRQDHLTQRQLTLRESAQSAQRQSAQSAQRQSAQGESTQLALFNVALALEEWYDPEGAQRGTPWDESSSP